MLGAATAGQSHCVAGRSSSSSPQPWAAITSVARTARDQDRKVVFAIRSSSSVRTVRRRRSVEGGHVSPPTAAPGRPFPAPSLPRTASLRGAAVLLNACNLRCAYCSCPDLMVTTRCRRRWGNADGNPPFCEERSWTNGAPDLSFRRRHASTTPVSRTCLWSDRPRVAAGPTPSRAFRSLRAFGNT